MSSNLTPSAKQIFKNNSSLRYPGYTLKSAKLIRRDVLDWITDTFLLIGPVLYIAVYAYERGGWLEFFTQPSTALLQIAWGSSPSLLLAFPRFITLASRGEFGPNRGALCILIILVTLIGVFWYSEPFIEQNPKYFLGWSLTLVPLIQLGITLIGLLVVVFVGRRNA